MARPLRIEYPGAWYHVMNRGSGRRRIFKTDEQRQYFLELLADTTDRFQAEWHAYCLLDNHYHLMLRTPEGNLQRIMRHTNGLYTQFFNRRERRDGALFRGRYKAILVDAEAYWLHLSRYIHRNPLEARMVKQLERYPWSSYRCYIGKANAPSWLTTHYILGAIGQRRRYARYQAFVAGDTDDVLSAFYEAGRQQPILGDKPFRQRVLEGRAPSVDIPELTKAIPRPDLQTIVNVVSRYYEVEEAVIWRSARGRGVVSPARSVVMYLCQRVGDLRLSEIANLFGLASYASAGSTIQKVKQGIISDKKLGNDINYILLDLTP